MTELLQLFPWAVAAVIFVGMLTIVLRLIGALDRALARQQTSIPVQTAVPSSVTAPSQKPTVPAPSAPVTPAVDQGLVDFIKKEEGFRATPYWDYKQWTVGYGTRASGPQDVVTEAEAERRLVVEVNAADKLVNDFMPNLPKGQRQALIDLTFNAGPGWEQGSLGAAVKAQKIDTIKADILLYNHAGGQVNAGLTTRREAEVGWFDHPL